jgi:membrane fusion protein, heavy metal efflux system
MNDLFQGLGLSGLALFLWAEGSRLAFRLLSQPIESHQTALWEERMSEPTILLVDDNEVLGQVLSRVLTQQKYHVVRAVDAAGGLEQARLHPPKLALVDWFLPDQDGLALGQQLRGLQPELPLILMTAYPVCLSDHPERLNIFSRVLTKPLQLQELRQVIAEALGEPVPRTEEAVSAAPLGEGEPSAEPPAMAAASAVSESPPATRTPPPQPASPRRWQRWLVAFGGVIGAATLVGAVWVAFIYFKDKQVAAGPAPAAGRPVLAELVEGRPDTIRLPADVVTRLGVKTQEVKPAQERRPLELSGSLAFDSNRLARVHTRFAGEVVDLGRVADTNSPLATAGAADHPVRFGDRVAKDQLLAVVWSKDLGEKKSELVDALSQLRLDQETLTRLEELGKSGATSEANIRQARRNYEADLTAVARAERTLRVWRLPEAEIDAVKEEAERIRQRKGQRDKDKERDWARVEVRAPLAGVIVEKNLNIGDIVDTSQDLFRLADVSHLAVWVHAYEENLPALLALPPQDRTWEVRLKTDPNAPALKGTIEEIGYVLDPSQHTALVMGHLENTQIEQQTTAKGEGPLRAGQFVTATVSLPPPSGVVAVPATALVEDGHESIVFVQEDPARPEYTLRRVAVQARFSKNILVRSRPSAHDGGLELEGLHAADLVVVQGAVELKAALEDLKSMARPAQ